MVGRHKERDLQQKRERAAQRIDRLVVVDAIIGLEHHIPLVALECLFDMLYPRRQLQLPLMLLSLDRVGAVVEGQQQKIDAEAQREDRSAGIVNDAERCSVHRLKKQFQRAEQQLVQGLKR